MSYKNDSHLNGLKQTGQFLSSSFFKIFININKVMKKGPMT